MDSQHGPELVSHSLIGSLRLMTSLLANESTLFGSLCAYDIMLNESFGNDGEINVSIPND